ncbi:MAG TPA: MBL fold metallo-hydrolase [Streptosporangiaceae bacterium]
MASLTFIGHATALLEYRDVRLLTDPVLRGRLSLLRRVVPPVPAASYADVDVVLLSHLHHDHCDLPSLARLAPEPTIVVPAGGAAFLRRRGFTKVVAVRPGDTHSAGPVTLTVTPALHDGRRTPFGPRAEAVGYLITTADTATYFAGDTDLFAGMRDLAEGLDLALLPVWGWGPNLGPGHLDPERAADAVALLRPHRAVPIHWGTLFPYGLERLYAHRLREPAAAFADAVAARRLSTEVDILNPGGELVWQR